MPARGGRVGGGSRGGGFRAPRSSGGSSGSRGARINIGSRAPRAASSAPSTNASSQPNVHHHRPWYRNRLADTGGGISIGLLIGLIVLGLCGCVALAFALQAFGFGA